MRDGRRARGRRAGAKAAPGSGKPAARGTRARLLEVGGQVFARRGFSLTTGKEICRLAGVNAAAINYHFGGVEPLYRAVLHEVVDRMVGAEALAATVAATADPREKLRAVVGFFVAAVTGPLAASWEVRVLAREVINPVAAPTLLEKEVGDRMAIIKGVVAGILGRPVTDPAVAVGYLAVMAPCLLLLIGDRDRFRRVFPSLKLEPAAREAITEQLVRTAYGALCALADREPSAKPVARPSAR